MSGDHLLAVLCSAGLRQLRRLELVNIESFTDLNLIILLWMFTRLIELCMSGCMHVTPASVSTFIFGAPQLRRVSVLAAAAV